MPQLDLSLFIYLQFLQYFYIFIFFYFLVLFYFNYIDFLYKKLSKASFFKNLYLKVMQFVCDFVMNIGKTFLQFAEHNVKNDFYIVLYRRLVSAI